MRVVVTHGYFAFYPLKRTDVLEFRRLYSTPDPRTWLFAKGDHFTFGALLDLPTWSAVGLPYGGFPALVNFAGAHPADVMRANRFVYNMQTALLVPAATMAAFVADLQQADDCILAPKMLLQPGLTFTLDGVPRGIMSGYTGNINLTREELVLSSVEMTI